MAKQALSADPPSATGSLPNVAALGLVSLLTAVSSAMIYGLLPLFLVQVLGINIAALGLIEGTAEAANSLIKIVSGAASDWIARRKPLVILGYALSAVVKTLFPQAETASVVLVARVFDRLGKGIRDAPRDAFLADVTPPGMRGASFGLRLALAIAGFVFGPIFAVSLMRLSADDFRLVFWIALVPAWLSVFVLVFAVKEVQFLRRPASGDWAMHGPDLHSLPKSFWWTIAIAGLLSLARFSPAFLLLKASATGLDAAYAPMILGLMYLVYSLSAYPFGMLADHFDRQLELGFGVLMLITADVIMAAAGTIGWVAFGAALWGLHLGATQAVIGAILADLVPVHLRGSAFGIYDVIVGVAAFAASAGAGVLWTIGGQASAFGVSAAIAIGAAILLTLQTCRLGPREVQSQ